MCKGREKSKQRTWLVKLRIAHRHVSYSSISQAVTAEESSGDLYFFPLNTDFDSTDPRDHKILDSSKLPGNAYVAVSQTILLNGEAVHSSVFLVQKQRTNGYLLN